MTKLDPKRFDFLKADTHRRTLRISFLGGPDYLSHPPPELESLEALSRMTMKEAAQLGYHPIKTARDVLSEHGLRFKNDPNPPITDKTPMTDDMKAIAIKRAEQLEKQVEPVLRKARWLRARASS